MLKLVIELLTTIYENNVNNLYVLYKVKQFNPYKANCENT